MKHGERRGSIYRAIFLLVPTYGAEILGSVVELKKAVRQLDKVQRSVLLSVTRSYRTTFLNLLYELLVLPSLESEILSQHRIYEVRRSQVFLEHIPDGQARCSFPYFHLSHPPLDPTTLAGVPNP